MMKLFDGISHRPLLWIALLSLFLQNTTAKRISGKLKLEYQEIYLILKYLFWGEINWYITKIYLLFIKFAFYLIVENTEDALKDGEIQEPKDLSAAESQSSYGYGYGTKVNISMNDNNEKEKMCLMWMPNVFNV